MLCQEAEEKDVVFMEANGIEYLEEVYVYEVFKSNSYSY